MKPERCKSCYKPFGKYDDRISGPKGEYHVTCWNQSGNKKLKKAARDTQPVASESPLTDCKVRA